MNQTLLLDRRAALAVTPLLTLAACTARPGVLTLDKPALLAAARRAEPPVDPQAVRVPDLVEVRALEPTIRLDVRYATARNFTGVRLYDEARVFLQRPAAEAVVRAHARLRAQRLGLKLFDGYRPWYVTRFFWDITPEAQRGFVADPARGSRHNRGCAVDLTLCDLTTGRTLLMPSDFDDFSARAAPDYPGGSAQSRSNRDRLRAAMEAEGFTVNRSEWWHFDFQGWQAWPIGNLTFAELDAVAARR